MLLMHLTPKTLHLQPASRRAQDAASELLPAIRGPLPSVHPHLCSTLHLSELIWPLRRSSKVRHMHATALTHSMDTVRAGSARLASSPRAWSCTTAHRVCELISRGQRNTTTSMRHDHHSMV